PSRMEAAPGVFHDVPPFDRDAMLIEADLLVDWYVPWISGKPASDALRAGYHKQWNALLDRLSGGEYTLMLRDFHSPNIIWRGERTGHDRLGIVDVQ
ncbi:bifunctional tRNA (adenosine(37)-N6)-threonylcarbamoyltransferase complex ATPase subunit type 1 TsaE/phosphotransferase, partial [bacterium M00.F.Ca.ET.222.01.1.1]